MPSHGTVLILRSLKKCVNLEILSDSAVQGIGVKQTDDARELFDWIDTVTKENTFLQGNRFLAVRGAAASIETRQSARSQFIRFCFL